MKRGLSILLTTMLLTAGAVNASKDVGKGHDHRTFHSNGTVHYGKIADSYTADLVMYLAGNQFMVMEELIQDFQGKHPDIKTVLWKPFHRARSSKGRS